MQPLLYIRSTLERVKPFITSSHLLIFVNKGIEISSLMLPSDIVTEILGETLGRQATFLSGPSFAVEVVKRQPTCVSVASSVKNRALRTQRLFHAPHFRVYNSHDVIGVEVSGALKNVIALAAGSCAGLQYQKNAQAAIITRG
jgi:glycerol-3-phosphate dehydrogenase